MGKVTKFQVEEAGGRKESVTLRQRKLSDGGASLYLDIMHNGKRYRETLHLYLLDGNSKLVKDTNRQTMLQAETVRAQRQIDLQRGQYEELRQFKPQTLFLSYYRMMCEKRLKTDTQGNWGNWRSCLRYLEAYCDESTTFKDITPEWIEGFKNYLENVEKNRHKKSGKSEINVFEGLSQNSKLSYFNKLKACINQAFDEKIIANNPLRGIKGFKEPEVKREHLDWDEVVKLDNTPCKYTYLKRAFLFSCFTGLRKSDIQKLTWDEVQKFGEFTRIVFKQKKTGGQEYLDRCIIGALLSYRWFFNKPDLKVSLSLIHDENLEDSSSWDNKKEYAKYMKSVNTYANSGLAALTKRINSKVDIKTKGYKEDAFFIPKKFLNKDILNREKDELE